MEAWWLDRWPLQSTFQSVLWQDAELQVAPIACVVEHFECLLILEKHCINAVHLPSSPTAENVNSELFDGLNFSTFLILKTYENSCG